MAPFKQPLISPITCRLQQKLLLFRRAVVAEGSEWRRRTTEEAARVLDNGENEIPSSIGALATKVCRLLKWEYIYKPRDLKVLRILVGLYIFYKLVNKAFRPQWHAMPRTAISSRFFLT